MQLVDNFTATLVNRKFSVDTNKPMDKLMFLRTGPTSVVGNLAGLLERLTIELNSKTGTQLPVSARYHLGAMAAFNQFGEGSIIETQLSSNQYQAMIVVAVCPEFGMSIHNTEEVTIKLEDIPVGVNYSMFALDAHVTGTNYYKYSTASIPEGQAEKTFDVDHASAWLLPNAPSAINRVNVTYANGGVDNFTIGELRARNSDDNDIESVVVYAPVDDPDSPFNGRVFTTITPGGQGSWVTLKLAEAIRIEVYTNGDPLTIYQLQQASRLVGDK